MKQEEQLKHLFDLARQEPVQTSVNDVKKWIGLGTFAIALASLLSQLKISLTKSIIMYTSIASVIGIGITAMVLSSSSEDKKATTSEAKPSTAVTLSKEEPIEKLEEKPERKSFSLIQPLQDMTLMEEVITELPPIVNLLPIQEENTVQADNQREEVIAKAGTNILKPFTEVHTSGLFTLILIQGDEYSYRAEGDYNADDLIISWDTNKDKGLYINYNSKKSKNNKRKNRMNKHVIDDTNVDNLTLYLTFKSIDMLKLNGITKTKAETTIEVKNFQLSINGASTADFKLNAKNLKFESSGVTKVKLESNVENLSVKIQGASSVEFSRPMDVENLDIAISGTSKLTLECNSVDQKILQQGASSINLRGNSTDSKIDISGTSSLKLAGNTSTLRTLVQGACDLNISGNANEVDIKISGTSSFKGTSLKTEKSKIEAQGASSVQLTSSNSSKVYASGSSTVKIAGNPLEFDSKVEGVASVKKM